MGVGGSASSGLLGVLAGIAAVSVLQWTFRSTESKQPLAVVPAAASLQGHVGDELPRHERRRWQHRMHRQHKQRASQDEQVLEKLLLFSPPSPTPWSPRACPLNCSNAGICNQDTGECLCRMGRLGSGCEELDAFPCNLPHGEQLVNRCAGHCDLESQKCICGGGKYPNRSMHKCEFKGITSWIKWFGPGWDYARTAESPRQLWSKASDAPAYLRAHPSFNEPAPPANARFERVAWCDADPALVARRQQIPLARCACNEGMRGDLCELPVLHACLNQCNGRGTCVFGYCQCDESWYGVDCSLHNGHVTVVQPSDHATTDQAAVSDIDYSGARGGDSGARIAATAAADAAAASAAALSQELPSGSPLSVCSTASAATRTRLGMGLAPGGRKRVDGTPFPAIFVYELPIEFNVRLWTGKTRDEDCAVRAYSANNATDWKQHAFGMEVATFERLLVSPHRVTDPNAADYFFVPAWGGCWLSRFSRPTARHHDMYEMRKDDPEVILPRAYRASKFYRRAYEYIRHAYPFWNRSAGADHLWTFPHDEGACLAPIEIERSVLVSHWGRTMLHPNNHTSTSTGQGWHVPGYFGRMVGAHRCFTPGKDVLLPIYKSRNFVQASPFVTGKTFPRNVLFNFRGNAHLNQPGYSLGLRQQLYRLLEKHPLRCVCADPGRSGNQILGSVDACAAGGGKDVDGCLLVGGHSKDYIYDLQRSVFCGMLPGNGWGHIEEPIISGCIPVIVMPDIHVQLEGLVDLSKIAVRAYPWTAHAHTHTLHQPRRAHRMYPCVQVRIERHELPHLVEILRALSPSKVASMQAEIAKVWERYTYSGLFKREHAMQIGAPDDLARSRVGIPPAKSDQKAGVFTALEPRLKGVDAVDTLVDHLRLRLLQQKAACPGGDTPRLPEGEVVEPTVKAPPVDHGPPFVPYPPVRFHVWTTGVT